MKIYLEFVEGTSSKFWSVEVDGATHTVRYGKIGSDGREKLTGFDSEEDATADAEKQAGKKRKKGYADAKPGATKAPAKKAAKEKAAKKSTTKKDAAKKGTKKAAAKKAGAKKGAAKKAPKKAKKKKPPSARTLKAFYNALKENKLEKIEKELDRAIDVNTTFDVHGGGDAWPALHYAVYHNAKKAANLLLDRGADATAKCKDGSSPLHCVKNAKLAKRLIEGGADVNGKTKYGRAPLHYVRSGAIAQALIEGGADPNLETKSGETPFECTTEVEIRDALLAGGSTGLRATQGEAWEVEKAEIGLAKIDGNRGSMGLGPDGELWVGGYEGLFQVNGDKATRYYKKDNNPAVDTILPAHGSTYVATNWGLLRCDGGSWTLYNSNNSPLHDHHIVEMSVVDDKVYCIGYESEAESKHISVFDGKEWQLLRPKKDLPDQVDPRKLMQDAAGKLVISDDDDGGIHTLQPDGSWEYYGFEKDVFTPKVYCMATHDGADYFGTHSGLFRKKGEQLEKIADGAFGAIAWVGDTLWAATNWDGVHAIGPSGTEVYDEERAGVAMDNVENMVTTTEGRLFLLASRSLIEITDGEFKKVAGDD